MRVVTIMGCVAALLAACSEPEAPAAAETPDAPAQAQVFPAGSMPIHPVQGSATLLTLTGVDTAQAAMTGRMTEADARELCVRAPNGEAAQGAMEQCIADALSAETQAEGGGLHTASADCVAGTLSSSDWGDFTLTGTEDRYGSGQQYPVFLNAEGAQVTGNGDGGSSANALFSVLCPARAAAWETNA